MPTLHHAIKVAASGDTVFAALSTIPGLRRWHLGAVEGGVEPGAVLRLTPRPGLRFAWRTDILEPGARIVQTCVEGPGNSVGKTLTLSVAGLPDGRTLVQLSDGEWPEGDPDLPLCNTRWGEALANLRDVLEGEGSRS